MKSFMLFLFILITANLTYWLIETENPTKNLDYWKAKLPKSKVEVQFYEDNVPKMTIKNVAGIIRIKE